MVASDKPKKTYKNNLLFEYLGNILQTKSVEKMEKHLMDPDFNSSFVPYMILRYLSMCKSKEVRNIVLENQIQLEHMKDKSQIYKFLLKTIPKQNSSFIQYIKG